MSSPARCLSFALFLAGCYLAVRRRPQLRAAVVFALLLVLGFAQAGMAQTDPLKFENNYFVTGGYVVGGWANKQISPSRAGYAIGTISIPDTVQTTAITVPQAGVPTQVPAGADIVAAFLYWTTVEKSQSAFEGQNAFFRGYAITGDVLGNPNAPVSWSSGGCAGASNGTTTMRAYRADVRPYLPVDSNGIVQPNASYTAELRDSGSNGNATPFSLGATLVIIYRVLSPDFPLTAVVLYDGAYAPSNSSSTMMQPLKGFYQPAHIGPVATITHIVANGQPNKSQTVRLNGQILPSLYGSTPPFPGLYNGEWDNPTWNVSAFLNAPPNDPSETTSVMPTGSNSGCVSWGAIIFSSTVQDSDADGLLDYWEQAPPNPVNPYSAGSPENPAGDPGYVDVGSGEFVALPGANPAQRDIFVQLDYMCSIVNPDGTCDTTNGYSFEPSPTVLSMMSGAFSGNGHGINVHFDVKHAIQEQTCTAADEDPSASPPALCAFPNQPGVVGWKGGLVFLKDEPLNYPDESSCQAAASGPCIRRFQPGRKDSYHYILSGHAVGVANWNFPSGTLTSAAASGTTVTFVTSTPHGLVVNPNAGSGRVTISDATSNPDLNGTYYVQSVPTPTSFTIQIANPATATYTLSTDPNLSIASGQAGTVSGFSDVGGADSVVTLGNWGPAGQAVNVQAGTYMHEFGHTLALSHGGYWYPDAPYSYVPTVGANCKPNFQSVMSYLFQFDLLDDGVLDYSEQRLNSLNENSLPGGLSVDPTDPSAPMLAFSTTKWFTHVFPGAGTPATQHCDGTPLLPTDPPMYRVEGTANPISPALLWASGDDVNFNGRPPLDANLRGYDDWASLDLRQIGATGSLSAGGGSRIGGGGGSRIGGGGGSRIGGGGGSRIGGGGGSRIGGGGGSRIGGGGVANYEIDFQVANSSVRPPRKLMGSVTAPPRHIQLSWTAPTFGTIAYYLLYKTVNGTPDPSSPIQVTGTSYLDLNVTCGPTYTYFVTANLSDGRESVPSNSVSLTACSPPYIFDGFDPPMATADPPNTGSYSGKFNASKSITAKWTLQDSNGNLVTDVNVNTLRAVGPFQPMPDGSCRTTQVPVYMGCSGSSCPASAVLFSPEGAKGNSTLRLSGSKFVFNWDTKTTPPSPTLGPCYVLELDLDSGQVERTGVKLQ